MTKDPVRLLDSASGSSPALRHLLRAGSSELPDTAQLASLAQRLGPMLDPPPEGGGGPAPEPTAAAASGLTVGVKVAIGAGLLAAGFALVAAPGMMSKTPDPAGPIAPVTVTTAPRAVVTSAQSRHAEAHASSVDSHAPPASRAKPQTDLAAEARLLEQARAALGSNASLSLSLCAEHARSFPRGLLSQEREIIAIQALERIGRTSEAEARAQRFADAHPGSPHLRLLAHLLKEHTGASPSSSR